MQEFLLGFISGRVSQLSPAVTKNRVPVLTKKKEVCRRTVSEMLLHGHMAPHLWAKSAVIQHGGSMWWKVSVHITEAGG